MGLAKFCGANGDAKWNNRRNLAAPPTVERKVLLIGAARNAKKAALRLKRPPYPSSGPKVESYPRAEPCSLMPRKEEIGTGCDPTSHPDVGPQYRQVYLCRLSSGRVPGQSR
jgi:hypothetical protein